ncbi:RagB/SusD family nutrient uptake outer membrane protein [Sphingobacterium faecale]|uniref:RagB/SusD family nutrient uptake outer membrane protein n=1 Tax=Sphingobacterium faecale TaxID=2803775 RepID=A0ABS1R7V5_9SPHI|nr:RagB/SusD family nutrient uptake outer membrane protein [Sphingobacterium faecale]MBL1410380.1 RagB/SusD family nutrient uptake outer membrane protein [Sphingobacterium faecale]
MKQLIIFFIVLGCMSCGDQFLDVKPGSDTVVPTTLDDFEQLMNNGVIVYAYPDMLDVLSDDYYIDYSYWQLYQAYNPVIANAHVWADDIFETIESDYQNWEKMYAQVFYANVVLEGVEKVQLSDKNKMQHNQVQGTALFLRAWALYNLAQLYAPAYKESTAHTDLGVPIPLLSDVNEKIKRQSVAEVYQQTLTDLEAAVYLVQAEVDYARPTKAAVYALRARVLLAMGRYKEALDMATQSIDTHDALVDLNVGELDYKKTLYMGYETNGPFIQSNDQNIQIEQYLFDSYELNDWRRSFFKLNEQGNPFYLSQYKINFYFFRGLDSDEQYLIKAECEARLGDYDEAMKTLNHLLKRVHSNYVDQIAANKEDALAIVLQERRKQLLFRGLRWSDLKRYNRDGANIALTRELGGQVYKLEPNSPKWLFPIPTNEIKTSGLLQNLR